MEVSAGNARRPANDAALIQAVRTALGREERLGGRPKINVSSCSFVVSLHGTVADRESGDVYERVVLGVPGVAGVKNELRIANEAVLDGRETG